MKHILVFGMVAVFAVSPNVMASGSSGGGSSSSKKVDRRKSIDQQKYKQGQSIFSGKAKIFEDVISVSKKSQQQGFLKRLQSKIAKKSVSDAKKLDVNTLAGRLTTSQYRALTYFVDVRFLNSAKYAQ